MPIQLIDLDARSRLLKSTLWNLESISILKFSRKIKLELKNYFYQLALIEKYNYHMRKGRGNKFFFHFSSLFKLKFLLDLENIDLFIGQE